MTTYLKPTKFTKAQLINGVRRLRKRLAKFQKYRECDVASYARFIPGIAKEITEKLSTFEDRRKTILLSQDGIHPEVSKCIGEHANFGGVRVVFTKELKKDTFIICAFD